MGSSVFDMIGPVMIGPSSSHTAGVARMGLFAHRLHGQTPLLAAVTFYNSFATTYKGHGSDRALMSGLLGHAPDDTRLPESLELGAAQGLVLDITTIGQDVTRHPNSIALTLESESHRTTLVGESLGGGVINISMINGYQAGIDGSFETLFIEADDRPGVIAFVAEVIAHDDCNIATMSVSRKARFGLAGHIMQIDTPPRPITLQYLASIEVVRNLTLIHPLP